jgi:hypothetical protein
MTLDFVLAVIGIAAATLLGCWLLTAAVCWKRAKVAAPDPAWVTKADVEAMLDERDKRPVKWVTQYGLEAHVFNGHLKFSQEVRADIRAQFAASDFIRRNEFDPCVAAYCRKSLDEGGELRARVLEIVNAATPICTLTPPVSVSMPAPVSTSTLQTQAAKANTRLRKLAQTNAAKRKARR